MSLARPPQKSRIGFFSIIFRLLMFVFFAALVGSVAWAISVENSFSRFETVDPVLAGPGVFVSVPTVSNLHYREIGSGPPVLLIHDADLAGGYQWLAMTDQLSGHRLIIPDMIDFGFSPRLPEPGRLHSVVGRAETLIAMLDELGVDKVAVVGAGLGGAVAAQMAVLNPNLVDQLVLIGPELLGPDPTWESIVYRLPIVGEAMNFTFLGAGPRADSRYLSECGTGGWCPSSDDQAARSEAARVVGTATALTAWAASPRAATVPEGLGFVTVPTLLIWGNADTITPLSQGHELQGAIEGSELAVVTGTAHHPHREDPAATGQAVASFLGG